MNAYRFEESIENAVASHLEAQDLLDGETIMLARGGDQENFITPRIQITFQDVSAVEPFDQINISGQGSGLAAASEAEFEYLKHQGTLALDLITDLSQGISRAKHSEITGKLRAAMLRTRVGFGSANLPYHNVSFIKMIGTSREQEGDLQVSSTSYDLRFAIKDEVFS